MSLNSPGCVQLTSLLLAAILTAGFYVGWNIGSNDAANAIGTTIGGGVLSYRRAVAMLVLFAVLGAVLQGGKVMSTVGEDIVTAPGGEHNPFSELPAIAVATLIAAGLWVTVASSLGFPVSTSQSMVGAVMGAGLLISALGPIDADVHFDKLLHIGLSWVIAPVGAAIAAFTLYRLFSPALRRVRNITTLHRIFSALVTAASASSAYTMGTNDVGASTGILHALSNGALGWETQMIGLFGGVALATGALTYSWKVVRTVGMGITRLDVFTACTAQIGAAITVWSFNQFGIPVSTSQAIVGGIAGAGLVKGISAVSGRRLSRIGITWILTPAVAACLSFSLGFLVTEVL